VNEAVTSEGGVAVLSRFKDDIKAAKNSATQAYMLYVKEPMTCACPEQNRRDYEKIALKWNQNHLRRCKAGTIP